MQQMNASDDSGWVSVNISSVTALQLELSTGNRQHLSRGTLVPPRVFIEKKHRGLHHPKRHDPVHRI
eukprot:4049670-Pyramimonas_sp.AAC.1